MESQDHIQTKRLDKIDLTGDEPVITTEVVNEVVSIVTIDGGGEVEKVSNVKDERPKRKEKNICEICLDDKAKYTCPGCHTKTCCLECVKKHKKLTDCTGERNKTEFIGKNHFDNLHLLSDYRFLEEANRIADNARRDPKLKRNFKLSTKDNLLLRAARKRKVNLKFMSKGMKRSKENQSYFVISKDELLWQVKFVFEDINEVVFKRTSETFNIGDMIKPYINGNDASTDDKIRFSRYINRCPNETVDVYLQNENSPDEPKNTFTKCEHDQTLREILENKTLVEYPVLYVVLPETSKRLREMKFKSADVPYKISYPKEYLTGGGLTNDLNEKSS